MSERLAKATTAQELRAEILATIDAEEDCIRAAEVEHRAALADLEQEATEARAAHDAAAALARRDYKAVPPLPPIVDAQPHQDALHQLLRAREGLQQRQVEILASALPQVVQAWDLARPQLDVQAREIAGEARELAEQYGAWHRLLGEARRSSEQPTRDRGRIRGGPSTRMRPRPGPHDVLDAASGVDICGFGPSDGDVRAMLVTGQLDDGSGRIVVDSPSTGERGPRRGDR